MIEFLSKSKSRGDEIILFNLIRIIKSTNLHSFLYSVRVRCDRLWFSVHRPFIEKSIEEQIINCLNPLLFYKISVKYCFLFSFIIVNLSWYTHRV